MQTITKLYVLSVTIVSNLSAVNQLNFFWPLQYYAKCFHWENCLFLRAVQLVQFCTKCNSDDV